MGKWEDFCRDYEGTLPEGKDLDDLVRFCVGYLGDFPNVEAVVRDAGPQVASRYLVGALEDENRFHIAFGLLNEFGPDEDTVHCVVHALGDPLCQDLALALLSSYGACEITANKTVGVLKHDDCLEYGSRLLRFYGPLDCVIEPVFIALRHLEDADNVMPVAKDLPVTGLSGRLMVGLLHSAVTRDMGMELLRHHGACPETVHPLVCSLGDGSTEGCSAAMLGEYGPGEHTVPELMEFAGYRRGGKDAMYLLYSYGAAALAFINLPTPDEPRYIRHHALAEQLHQDLG